MHLCITCHCQVRTCPHHAFWTMSLHLIPLPQQEPGPTVPVGRSLLLAWRSPVLAAKCIRSSELVPTAGNRGQQGKQNNQHKK